MVRLIADVLVGNQTTSRQGVPPSILPRLSATQSFVRNLGSRYTVLGKEFEYRFATLEVTYCTQSSFQAL
jgi:hypothetical protein